MDKLRCPNCGEFGLVFPLKTQEARPGCILRILMLPLEHHEIATFDAIIIITMITIGSWLRILGIVLAVLFVLAAILLFLVLRGGAAQNATVAKCMRCGHEWH